MAVMWALCVGACAAALQACLRATCGDGEATWALVLWYGAFAGLGVAASRPAMTVARAGGGGNALRRAVVLAAWVGAMLRGVCATGAAATTLACGMLAYAVTTGVRLHVALLSCALLSCAATCVLPSHAALHVRCVCAVCAATALVRVHAPLPLVRRDALLACALLAGVALAWMASHGVPADGGVVAYTTPCVVFACAALLTRAAQRQHAALAWRRGALRVREVVAMGMAHALVTACSTDASCVVVLAHAVSFVAAVTLVCGVHARATRTHTLPRDGDRNGKHSSDGGSNAVRAVLGDARSRRLALFLCLTLFVMLLELGYGVHANSLGLVSDAFHMLMDAASLAVGLCAAYATSWPADVHTHPLGYARYEVLGGFVNGVLLVCIAVCVLRESLERVLHAPVVDGDYLLAVSVVGLLVNVVGVCCFHGAQQCHHGGGSGGACAHAVDHNMRGVYLHILADLLGSVSVIVSSLCVRYAGWWVADPLCSALCSALILLSSLPLLVATGSMLLLATPSPRVQHALRDAAAHVCDVDALHCWQHATTPHAQLVCALRGRLARGADYDDTRQRLHEAVRHAVAHHGTVHCTVHLE